MTLFDLQDNLKSALLSSQRIILYFVHGTTLDNEKDVVSGHYDCPLSELGSEQTLKLARSLSAFKISFEKIFVSSLTRAQETADLLFPNQEVIKDPRLMEIDYGTFTHYPKSKIDGLKEDYIDQPFPKGESYHDVEKRIRDFLNETSSIPILTLISHQAPQLALEVITNGLSFEEAFQRDWRLAKRWQPFWIYRI